MSVPSSKITYTKDAPKKEKPRTTFDFGTESMAVVSG
jgi:hypothetical protein